MKFSFFLLIGALFISQSFALDLFSDDAHLIEKRAVSYCPNVTCASSASRQTCNSVAVCHNCNATYVACKAGLNETSTSADICACFQAAYNCSLSSSQCFGFTNYVTDECIASPAACSNCKAIQSQPNLVRQCSSDGYCNTNGVCTQKTRNGTCTTDDQCGDITSIDGRPYYCQSGKCGFQPNTIKAGDICTSPADCIAGADCTAGQCVGVKTGLSCVGPSSLNCEQGSYCYSSTGLCTAQLVAGEICSHSEIDQCGLGLFCSKSNNTCMPYFSTPQDGICSAGRFECQYGSICLNGICSPRANYLVPCSSDTDCPGSECICSIDGNSRCKLNALPVKSSCERDYQTALTCAKNNKCTSISDDPTTCCGAKCWQEMRCLYTCVFDTFSLEVGKAFGCPYYPSYKCRIQYSSAFYLPTAPANDTAGTESLVPLLSSLLLFLF